MSESEEVSQGAVSNSENEACSSDDNDDQDGDMNQDEAENESNSGTDSRPGSCLETANLQISGGAAVGEGAGAISDDEANSWEDSMSESDGEADEEYDEEEYDEEKSPSIGANDTDKREGESSGDEKHLHEPEYAYGAKRLIANVYCSEYDIVSKVLRKVVGFKLREYAEDWEGAIIRNEHNQKLSKVWDLTWHDLSIAADFLAKMHLYQKVNHYPGMYVVTRKNHLARNLMRMQRSYPQEYDFFPQTWVLPGDNTDFRNQAPRSKEAKKKNKQCYIVKPDGLSQGKGIFMSRDPERILRIIDENQQSEEKMGFVVQHYLDEPHLVDYLKYDLRIYVLLYGVNPLRIYIHEEGMARFATEPYRKPTQRNLNNLFMHLTNYSINKTNAAYLQGEDEISSDGEESGHKRSLNAIMAILAAAGADKDLLMKQIKDIIVKTLTMAQPFLGHLYRSCQPECLDNSMCYQILGFDIFIDRQFKPWLIEINQSPSFATDSPLDYRIKKAVLTDTFQLLNVSYQKRKAIIKYQKEQMQARILTGKQARLDPEAKAALRAQKLKERFEHEDKNRGGFELIFPAQDADRNEMYEKFIKRANELWDEFTTGKVKKEKFEPDKPSSIAKSKQKQKQKAVPRQAPKSSQHVMSNLHQSTLQTDVGSASKKISTIVQELTNSAPKLKQYTPESTIQTQIQTQGGIEESKCVGNREGKRLQISPPNLSVKVQKISNSSERTGQPLVKLVQQGVQMLQKEEDQKQQRSRPGSQDRPMVNLKAASPNSTFNQMAPDQQQILAGQSTNNAKNAYTQQLDIMCAPIYEQESFQEYSPGLPFKDKDSTPRLVASKRQDGSFVIKTHKMTPTPEYFTSGKASLNSNQQVQQQVQSKMSGNLNQQKLAEDVWGKASLLKSLDSIPQKNQISANCSHPNTNPDNQVLQQKGSLQKQKTSVSTNRQPHQKTPERLQIISTKTQQSNSTFLKQSTTEASSVLSSGRVFRSEQKTTQAASSSVVSSLSYPPLQRPPQTMNSLQSQQPSQQQSSSFTSQVGVAQLAQHHVKPPVTSHQPTTTTADSNSLGKSIKQQQRTDSRTQMYATSSAVNKQTNNINQGAIGVVSSGGVLAKACLQNGQLGIFGNKKGKKSDRQQIVMASQIQTVLTNDGAGTGKLQQMSPKQASKKHAVAIQQQRQQNAQSIAQKNFLQSNTSAFPGFHIVREPNQVRSAVHRKDKMKLVPEYQHHQNGQNGQPLANYLKNPNIAIVQQQKVVPSGGLLRSRSNFKQESEVPNGQKSHNQRTQQQNAVFGLPQNSKKSKEEQQPETQAVILPQMRQALPQTRHEKNDYQVNACQFQNSRQLMPPSVNYYDTAGQHSSNSIIQQNGGRDAHLYQQQQKADFRAFIQSQQQNLQQSNQQLQSQKMMKSTANTYQFVQAQQTTHPHQQTSISTSKNQRLGRSNGPGKSTVLTTSNAGALQSNNQHYQMIQGFEQPHNKVLAVTSGQAGGSTNAFQTSQNLNSLANSNQKRRVQNQQKMRTSTEFQRKAATVGGRSDPNNQQSQMMMLGKTQRQQKQQQNQQMTVMGGMTSLGNGGWNQKKKLNE